MALRAVVAFVVVLPAADLAVPLRAAGGFLTLLRAAAAFGVFAAAPRAFGAARFVVLVAPALADVRLPAAAFVPVFALAIVVFLVLPAAGLAALPAFAGRRVFAVAFLAMVVLPGFTRTRGRSRGLPTSDRGFTRDG